MSVFGLVLDELTDVQRRIDEIDIQLIEEHDPVTRAELIERLSELELQKKHLIDDGALGGAIH